MAGQLRTYNVRKIVWLVLLGKGYGNFVYMSYSESHHFTLCVYIIALSRVSQYQINHVVWLRYRVNKTLLYGDHLPMGLYILGVEYVQLICG